jgi:hypothetical protein
MAVLPKAITSSIPFQDPQGTVLAAGFLTFDLSAPSQIVGSGGQVAPTRVFVSLTSAGQVPGGSVMWANDQLTPTGTIYYVRMFNSNGLLVSGPLFWSITGSGPIDLSQEFPVATSTLSFSLPGINQSIFTVNGTFTIPASVTKLKVTVVGAGGAGGGANSTVGGSGGGSGGAGIKWLTGLTPGNTLTVSIGVGGTGVSAANGNPGTGSTVSSGTQIITSIVTNGGLGGAGIGGTSGAGGGGAAIGTGGDVNVGGAGGQSITAVGASLTMAGAGASSILGGGAGSPGITGTGNIPTAPGGGGSGALGGANAAGGNGANGIVIFEWIL